MMLRALPVVLVLAACGPREPASTDERGGAGGGDPCAGVEVRLLGAGPHFDAPLHDGDTVHWQQGPESCCDIWTGVLVRGFPETDHIVYSFDVSSADGTDLGLGLGYCEEYDQLTEEAGWREATCLRDRMSPPAVAGPVKVKVTVRNGIAYDPGSAVPCSLAQVPHCEASDEVMVVATAPDADQAAYCDGHY